jgi:hypothetical protein
MCVSRDSLNSNYFNTEYQNVRHYSETNMMHFLFSLFSIKGLYMFRALPAHPQEVLRKRHLVYCTCVMSAGCTRVNPGAAN